MSIQKASIKFTFEREEAIGHEAVEEAKTLLKDMQDNPIGNNESEEVEK